MADLVKTAAVLAATSSQSAASRMLDTLENPNTYSALVANLLTTLEMFGSHVSPQGTAIAGLAYALLQIFHPAPHTVPVPTGVPGLGPITVDPNAPEGSPSKA